MMAWPEATLLICSNSDPDYPAIRPRLPARQEIEAWCRNNRQKDRGFRPVNLRKARMSDVESIHQLINEYAARGLMLPRSRSMLYENLREFTVLEEAGKYIGSGALHIIWEDLAEIRALALHPDFTGRGLGRRLVAALIDEARALEINKVFALTSQPEFFQRCGFKPMEKDEMPQKVWKECINCPKFPNCDEVALIYESRRPSEGV